MFCTSALENVSDHRGLRQTPFGAVSYYLSKIWEILKPHPKSVVCLFVLDFFCFKCGPFLKFLLNLLQYYFCVMFFDFLATWQVGS